MIHDLQEWIGTNAALFELGAVIWFLVLALLSIPAGIYIVKVYRSRYEEAPFLTRLVLRDIRVWAATMLLLVLVAGSLLRFVSRPWGTLTICAAVTIYAWGLIDDALTFRRERAQYRKENGHAHD